MAQFIFRDDSRAPESSKLIVVKISDNITLHMKSSFVPLVVLNVEECKQLVDDVMKFLVDECNESINVGGIRIGDIPLPSPKYDSRDLFNREAINDALSTTISQSNRLTNAALILANNVAAVMKLHGFTFDQAMLIVGVVMDKES